MERRRCHALLVCLWVALRGGGLVMVVHAQSPSVEVRVLTSNASIREGGTVEMLCIGENLRDGVDTVGWAIGSGNAQQTLRIDQLTMHGVTSRYTFRTNDTGSMRQQYFTINDLQRNDSNEYTCNVTEYTNRSIEVVDTQTISISVLYFPNVSFPVCFPDGPITVDTGTEVSMRCTSESGNPRVGMAIFQLHLDTRTTPYPEWTAAYSSETISSSLKINVTAADNNAAFVCVISSASFPKREANCTIGPITVRQATVTTERPPAGASTPSLPPPSPSPANLALIAGASVGGAAAALLGLTVLALVCVRRRGRRRSEKTPQSARARDQSTHCQPDESLQETTTDAYIDLRPTNTKNTEYMGLNETHSNPANQAYCQRM